MVSQKTLFFLCFFISFIICYNSVFVDARKTKFPKHIHKQIPKQYNDYGIKKLFVFGDSYADTGNLRYMFQRQPYGKTMSKPRGRYSDGLILTDYVAKFLGLKTPVAYHWRHNLKEELHYGMNFAYGGAGVFDTENPRPHISQQVDLFEKLVKDNEYTTYDLESSLFLLTLAGNDYIAFVDKGGGVFDLLSFYPKVVDAFSESLERLSKLGAKRIAVGSLQPLGCLPYLTMKNGYKACNSTGNLLVELHNEYLTTKIEALNAKRLTTNFLILDLNATFTDTIFNKQDLSGKLKFEDPFRPCCEGSCGDTDEKGQKLYTVCDDPKNYFFWDSVHPTQAGWNAVFEALIPTFKNISSFGSN